MVCKLLPQPQLLVSLVLSLFLLGCLMMLLLRAQPWIPTPSSTRLTSLPMLLVPLLSLLTFQLLLLQKLLTNLVILLLVTGNSLLDGMLVFILLLLITLSLLLVLKPREIYYQLRDGPIPILNGLGVLPVPTLNGVLIQPLLTMLLQFLLPPLLLVPLLDKS